MVNSDNVEELTYKQKYYRCLIAMNEFNYLPWYKRIFFRFNIYKFKDFNQENINLYME